MQAIAAQIGVAATCFLSGNADDGHAARFFSPSQEYALCGHGIVAMFSHLAQTQSTGSTGALSWRLELQAQVGTIAVEVFFENGTRTVMLTQQAPTFSPCELDFETLAGALGIAVQAIVTTNPLEVVSTGTPHLFVQVESLETLHRLEPDLAELTALSGQAGVGTIDVFVLETVDPGGTVHSRDFCPALGAPEAVASGTTNGALSCYLMRHGLVRPDPENTARIVAEQGHSLGRPSRILTEVTLDDSRITQVKVGGTAFLSLQGRINVPD